MVIELPARFTQDHIDRCCAAGVVMSKNSKTIILDSTPEQIECLLSDADYYISMARELDKCYMGLVSSARATKRAIEKVSA